MIFSVLRSRVFRSSGERAAWLLLCAWTHWLRDEEVGADICLFCASEALGLVGAAS